MSATVERARIKLHSTDFACDVLRAVGWQARCACGAPFPIRKDPDRAKDDKRRHICGSREAVSATGGTEAS